MTDTPDPEWNQDERLNREDRYGGELGAILEKAGEALIDPDGLSRSVAEQPTEMATAKRKPAKRYRAGSTHLDVDAAIGRGAIDALWHGPGAPDRATRVGLVKCVLEAVKPRNELEGLLAVQLIAAHGAALENYRRAMIPSQTAALASEALNQAAKASRTFATLVEALDRHRGKGARQRVEVRHVHVHAGGQAVVGVVEGGARGAKRKSREPHAIAHSSQPTLPRTDEVRRAVSGARDE